MDINRKRPPKGCDDLALWLSGTIKALRAADEELRRQADVIERGDVPEETDSE